VNRSLILILLKFPEPGKVKTRLAATTGAQAAALIYRRLVRDVLTIAATAPGDRVRIQFDPPSREAEVRDWIVSEWQGTLERLDFRPQTGDGLGERMANAFATAFQEGYAKVALIGTDCVDITASTFTKTWDALDTVDAVYGPADDGGFYLLGLKGVEHRLFQVPWSSPDTLSASLERAEEAGLQTTLLEKKPDIDTEDQWLARKSRVILSAPVGDQPIVFAPEYFERVWGGRSLAEQYGRAVPDGPIGESWELSDRAEAQSVVKDGALMGFTLNDLWRRRRREVFGKAAGGDRFPLLVKILDAREVMSLQVHPPELVAPGLGGEPKTEMWYVAHAEPGAKVYAGLKKGVSRAAFAEAIEQGTAANYVHEIPVKTGDAVFIPSGRLHAIGGGLLIFEIQQNSDTTYRVFDWNRLGTDGRPRALHVPEAMQSIMFDDITPSACQPVGETLVSCAEFVVQRWHLAPGQNRQAGGDGEFAIVTVIDGTVICGGREFRTGDFFAIPAAATSALALRSGGGQAASILRTSFPPATDALTNRRHESFYLTLRDRIAGFLRDHTGIRPRWIESVLLTPDFFYLLCKLSIDPRVPVRYRVQLGVVIAYFISPIDLLPEGLIGPIGYLDDVALAAYAINQMVNKVDPEIVREHWAGEGDALELARHIVNEANSLIGGGLWERVKKIWKP